MCHTLISMQAIIAPFYIKMELLQLHSHIISIYNICACVCVYIYSYCTRVSEVAKAVKLYYALP